MKGNILGIVLMVVGMLGILSSCGDKAKTEVVGIELVGISATDTTLMEGETLALEVKLLPENISATYNVNASDESVVSLSQDGKTLQALKEGKVVVTISAGDVKKVLNIEVKPVDKDLKALMGKYVGTMAVQVGDKEPVTEEVTSAIGFASNEAISFQGKASIMGMPTDINTELKAEKKSEKTYTISGSATVFVGNMTITGTLSETDGLQLDIKPNITTMVINISYNATKAE